MTHILFVDHEAAKPSDWQTRELDIQYIEMLGIRDRVADFVYMEPAAAAIPLPAMT